jgi:hypothetical protein
MHLIKKEIIFVFGNGFYVKVFRLMHFLKSKRLFILLASNSRFLF